MEKKEEPKTGESLAKRLQEATEKQRERNIDNIPSLESAIESCKADINGLWAKLGDLESQLKKMSWCLSRARSPSALVREGFSASLGNGGNPSPSGKAKICEMIG